MPRAPDSAVSRPATPAPSALEPSASGNGAGLRVAILALEGFVPFDLSIPYNMFGQAVLPDGRKSYGIFFAGPQARARSGSLEITGCLPLASLETADTIIIPGLSDPLGYQDASLFEALRAAARRGARLASICTGAFILASAGLLDGLSATTHWELAPALQAAFPAVTVEPDVLFVDNGAVLTSAGLASGLDLCLHIIRKDYGAVAAGRSAEFFVLPPERDGGHKQRLRRQPGTPGSPVAALQMWMLENLHTPLTLHEMAAQGCMSERTLNRKFRDEIGQAPMLWLTKARIRRAQALLEASSLAVEQIGEAVGFASPSAFRDAFRRLVGVSPSAWRKTYARPQGDGMEDASGGQRG